MIKKLLSILVLGLLCCNVSYSKIVFRAECENPNGVRFSTSILHLQNDRLLTGEYEKDKFLGDDYIELIYDNSKPNQIQFIWGTDNRTENLSARNEKFYHWGFIKENLADGFYYGHWSLSIPNKTLTYYKGNTRSDGISTAISNGMFSSKCKIKK